MEKKCFCWFHVHSCSNLPMHPHIIRMLIPVGFNTHPHASVCKSIPEESTKNTFKIIINHPKPTKMDRHTSFLDVIEGQCLDVAGSSPPLDASPRSMEWKWMRVARGTNRDGGFGGVGDGSKHTKAIYYLVGGLEHFLFSHILGIIIPID